MSDTGVLDPPELPDPPEPTDIRLCTYAGCDQLATTMYGPKAMQMGRPNRCEEHGPMSNPAFRRAAEKAAEKAANPPKLGRPPGSGSGPAARKASLEGRLNATIALVGTVVCAFDLYDGQAILARSEALSGALDRLALENPKIRRALEAAMNGGAWGEVVMVVAPMAVAILCHHGILPESVSMLGNIGA